MNKRTQIILFTAFSLIIGPLIILGFILKLAGKMLDILGWLCLQILGVVPVASYVADKLEGIIILLIMLWKIGSHL